MTFPTLHVLEPDTDPRDVAAQWVEESNRFTADAVAWYADNLDRFPDAIEQAEARYRASGEFDTFVDDFMSGEVSL